ncbi:glutamate cyclase domain-containing protein [uncultured Cloacibacillus sp.]|uniref:glutamate cyclase domain-containing protein n=1 Tax=uncultured Cloacibacillus sp. TaxID=889794 RepID=UPI00262D0691|nr:glutamate cyclase domain-containing protein [uncultured Cloacibacillus sp.]
MNEALFESFAKELTALVARDEAGRGASKLSSPRELMRAASAFAPLRKLAVVSGFYVPAAGAPETDGPGGAAILARAFQREGRVCEIWTDVRCIEVLAECAKAAGCAENTARIAPASLKERAPDGIIFVERLGRAADGRYYNFKKQDISEWTAPLDALADEAAGLGIHTIGIGDGGNEAGMGNFYAELCALLPGYAACLSVVRAEFALTADVSNWGAYALAEALSFVWGVRRGIEPGEETKMLEAAARAGAADGISGRCETSVDGFCAAALEQKIAELDALSKKYAALRAAGN